jgi:hypothetical protein
MSASWPGSLRVLAAAFFALFVFQTTSVGQYSPVVPVGDGVPDGASDDGFARVLYPSSEAPFQLHVGGVGVAAARGRVAAADLSGSSAAGTTVRRGRGVYPQHLRGQVLSYLKSATANSPDYLYTTRPVGGDFREGMAASSAAPKDNSPEGSEEMPVIFSLRPNWAPRKPPAPDPTEDDQPDRAISTFYYQPSGDLTASLVGARSISSDNLSDYVQDFDQDPIEYRSVNGWTEDDAKPRASSADGSILVEPGSRDGLLFSRWHSGMFWNSRVTETASGETMGVGAEAAPVGLFQRLLRWALRNPATAAFVAAVGALFLAVVVAKNPTEAPRPG